MAYLKSSMQKLNYHSALNVQSSEGSASLSIVKNFNSHLNDVSFQNFIVSFLVQQSLLLKSREFVQLTQFNSFNKVGSLSVVRKQPNVVQGGVLVVSDGIILAAKNDFVNWSQTVSWVLRDWVLLAIIILDSLLECSGWHVENLTSDKELLSFDFVWN